MTPNSRSYLNHFTQPDSIVPDPYNPQDWDRFSYARNNPLKYTDPSGHSPCYGDNYDDGPQCAKNGSPSKWYYDNWKYQKRVKDKIVKNLKALINPSGGNIELNIFFGGTVNANGYDGQPATVGLLYYSIGMVTDKDGNAQFYYTTKDQTYIPGSSDHMGGYLSGTAEATSPSSAYGLPGGITLSKGFIFGEKFTTADFLGKGFSSGGGAGPFSLGASQPLNKSYTEVNAGFGVGGIVSMGTVATETHGLGEPIPLPPMISLLLFGIP